MKLGSTHIIHNINNDENNEKNGHNSVCVWSMDYYIVEYAPFAITIIHLLTQAAAVQTAAPPFKIIIIMIISMVNIEYFDCTVTNISRIIIIIP